MNVSRVLMFVVLSVVTVAVGLAILTRIPGAMAAIQPRSV